MISPDQSELVRLAVAAVLERWPSAERLAYPLSEAAQLCGIPRRTLQDAYSRGEFRAVKRCGKLIVTRKELLRWLSDSN